VQPPDDHPARITGELDGPHELAARARAGPHAEHSGRSNGEHQPLVEDVILE
jgi:hypothetical protein